MAGGNEEALRHRLRLGEDAAVDTHMDRAALSGRAIAGEAEMWVVGAQGGPMHATPMTCSGWHHS